MKKYEIYKGYRFPCETKMFKWNEGFLTWNISKDCTYNMPPYSKRNLDKCPCGKNCEPIEVEIIVKNKIKRR